MTRLGELLLARGLDDSALAEALEAQRHTGARLGDVLAARGNMSPLPVHEAVAAQQRLPFINLLAQPPEADLPALSELHDYIRLRVIPWRSEEGTVVLASSEPGAALNAWAEAHYGQHWRVVMTSPLDIRRAIETCFARALTLESRLRLFRVAPALSARHTLYKQQRWQAPALLALVSAMVFMAPAAALVALQGLYMVSLGFKAWLWHASRRYQSPRPVPLPAAELPVYTVLVPLYQEARVVRQLISSLAALNYPPERLDIKLILEEDDAETLAALRSARPPWYMEIIRVPPSQPRTKPKACNYALAFARGEFVTIYDAEDQPHPDQLQLAAATFRALPAHVACVQARLGYDNAPDTLLSRWFAMEYAVLFGRFLPGLAALGIPIPLGGTSNHLRTDVLRALGEWDAFNVTEDADLGMRLAAQGYATHMLSSDTWEEAPMHLAPWLKQRARWIKGYMQTWLVHMRAPWQLLRAVGSRGFWGMQCFVGLPALIFLSALPVWAASALVWPDAAAAGLPSWFHALAAGGLAMHFVLHWAMAATVTPHLRGYAEHRATFWLAAALYPFYWTLHSLASYRAVWQLVAQPHHWDKTTHGLAKRTQRVA